MQAIPYLNPFVRDLAWVITSPELMVFEQAEFPVSQDLSAYDNWLKLLDSNPKELMDYLQGLNRKTLGAYFERLVQFWLIHTEGKLLTSNLPIFNKKETVTEIDVLFRINNNVYHIELSVKFYLSISSGFAWNQFIGPNQKDSLERKLSKMDSQLKAANSDFALRAFRNYGVKEYSQIKLLKGYIFYGHNTIYNRPFNSNPDHLNSFWLPFDKLQDYLSKNNYYRFLTKLEWLAPIFEKNDTHIICSEQLLGKLAVYFQHSSRPILISELKYINGFYIEEHKIFITPINWPL